MNLHFINHFEISFGTWPLKGQLLEDSILHAIKVGYKSFDTAQMYGNEGDIGDIFFKHGLNRKEFSITTKVLENNFDKRFFVSSVENSMKKLKTDYIDVLLLHWPNKNGDNDEALEGLQNVYNKGYAKKIGVSNYTISMMQDAVKKLSVQPITNQVEFHPLIDTTKLKKAANNLEIPLSAYCPLARGKVYENSIIVKIANTYGKTAGQIALRWVLEQNVSINTMSTKLKNIRDNFNIYDFSLSQEDIQNIDSCMKNNFRIVDKNIKPNAPIWD